VLTTSDLLAFADAILDKAPELAALDWIAVDTLPPGSFSHVAVDPEDIAFIQYTSGSTATPKGVMVTHEGALANLRMIKERCGQNETRSFACWVPPFHDMGLVCGILLPAFFGGPSVLMSPLDFLRQPAIWFQAIQRYRLTDTCAPNFALDLCTSRITPEQRASLDLSTLKVFVISAEPVRHSSLQRFIRTFEPTGISPSCVMPAYGLAEAVVAVAIARPGSPPSAAYVNAIEFTQNRWVELPENAPEARPLVRCGPPLDGIKIEIVDPDERVLCEPGRIGEIWIAGPNVALGYWNHPAETRETFGACVAGTDEGPFLRTGDLGYIRDGELYVTGRIKDLMVIYGRNHYPQDIELAVEHCHPAIRRGCVIAFSIEVGGAERLVVVAEVNREKLSGGPDAPAQRLEDVVHAICMAVSAEFGVQVFDVALIKPKTIDKTSSGKLARRACRQRYLDGRLETDLPCRTGPFTTTGELPAISSKARSARDIPSVGPTLADQVRGLDPEQQRPLLAAYLRKLIETTLGPGADRVDLTQHPRQEFGLDSLAALELTGRVDKDLKIKLPLAKLHEGVSFDWLVEHLLERLAASDAKHAATSGAADGRRGSPLCIALQPIVVRRPFFCVGGAPGAVLHLRALAQALGRDQPFYALQAPGIDGQEAPLGTIEQLAQRYIEEVKQVQPRAPYIIGGYSFGGLVAYEMAQRLTALGERVSRVILLDTITLAPDDGRRAQVDPSVSYFELLQVFHAFGGRRHRDLPASAEQLAEMSPAEQRALLLRVLSSTGGAAQESLLGNLVAVYEANLEASRRYRPKPYRGPVTLIRAERGFTRSILHPSRELKMELDEPSLGWRALCPELRLVTVSGDHLSMVADPHVRELGATTRAELDAGGTIEISTSASLADGEPVSPVRTEPLSIAPADGGVLFNPFHPDFLEDPYPMLHRLRAEDPVHWGPMSLWCVSRFTDVVAGLRDKRFSADSRHWANRAGQGIPRGSRVAASVLSGRCREDPDSPQARLYNNLMMTLDPPRHTRLRKLVSTIFEPGSVRRWRGYIQQCVDTMLADALARGNFDVMRDVALPLPITVIAQLLGIPRDDVPMLRQWSFELTQAFDPVITRDVFERADRVAVEFTGYIRRHVEAERSNPRGELLAMLLAAEMEGDRLTMDELIANCVLAFMAGFETTTYVIGNGVLALLRNPEQMQLLLDRPDIIENAVEELLRYDGAFRHIYRTAVEDVDMGGKLIRSGDYVLFLVPAANRDPDEFPDPDRLDLTRKIRQHVAFGQGIHYCLGAPLARLELQIAIQTIVQRMPRMKLIPGGLRWRKSISLRGLDSLQISPE
jgi:cytochrome P450/acyl-CoA synthetase (AMP-forming)/AMP-acid ligase II/thioesterase domain-containing protein/acyl carrier protein